MKHYWIYELIDCSNLLSHGFFQSWEDIELYLSFHKLTGLAYNGTKAEGHILYYTKDGREVAKAKPVAVFSRFL